MTPFLIHHSETRPCQHGVTENVRCREEAKGHAETMPEKFLRGFEWRALHIESESDEPLGRVLLYCIPQKIVFLSMKHASKP